MKWTLGRKTYTCQVASGLNLNAVLLFTKLFFQVLKSHGGLLTLTVIVVFTLTFAVLKTNQIKGD